MFLPPRRFAFTRTLEANFEIFRREWSSLTQEDLTPWPVRDAYSGQWLVFPLFPESLPEGIVVNIERNQARCPESVRVLRAIPGFAGAGFSTMTPGTRIHAHADAKERLLIRCHLGIDTNREARIRVCDEVRNWDDGKCLLFDGFLEHETANLGVKPRTVLLTDFRLPVELADDMGMLHVPSSREGVPVRAEAYSGIDAVKSGARR